METAAQLSPRCTANTAGAWLTLSVGAIDWILHPRFARSLDEHDLNRLPTAEPTEIVKTGAHRTVYRRELANEASSGGESADSALSPDVYFVKHFRIAGWQALAQNLVRPCKAELEWRAVRRVTELGIPTAEVVALGRVWQSGIVRDNYLITRDLNAEQLDTWLKVGAALPPHRRQQVRAKLAVALGRIAGRLHACGVEHTDFHPGNVLIRLGPGDEPRLWLIDLHAVRMHGRMSLARAARSLAALQQFFQHQASRTDLLRFYSAYTVVLQQSGQAQDWSTCSSRLLFASHCELATAALWNRADRAWKRGNRHQRKLSQDAVQGRGLAVLNQAWLRSILAQPERLFTGQMLRWCKNTGKRRVAEVNMPAVGSTGLDAAADDEVVSVYAKCIESRGLQRYVLRCRASRVRWAWQVGHAFLRRGLPTPRPLVYLESRGGDCDRQYLVTEAVPRSLTLAEFCKDDWPCMSPAQRREWLQPLSQRLARLVRRLHDCRYDHRDIKFENLLVSQVSVDDAPPAVWFLDLDAVRQWPMLPQARCIQNLSRINVSALHLPDLRLTDRLRFLKAYLGAGAASYKSWWRSIARKSAQKHKQNASRGRRLS